MGSGLAAHAQTESQAEKLEKENQQLKQRLDAVEELLKKEGITSSSQPASHNVAAMSSMTISGFVTASYFEDVASSKDIHPVGYLWNTSMNQFSLNKVKLTIASPTVDKEKWDAAYRVSMMYGQDATITDPNSKPGGAYPTLANIREAYLELNVPIGTGLGIKAGELISLMNYESGDGGAANANFSQGYQWYYTGNPPGGAIQASYDINSVVGFKARLQNGLYTGEFGTGGKTFLGGFYINPDKKTSLSFIGFAGEQNFAPEWYLAGGAFIGSRQLFEQYNVTIATEFDYFNYSGFNSAQAGFPTGSSSGDFWSIGGWLTADFTPKFGVALRAELIDDPSGFGTFWNSPSPANTEGYGGSFPYQIYTTGAGQDLTSVTFTLNYRPVGPVKIQPEVRWNHSNFSGAFGNGKSDQVIVGMGATYLF